MSSTSLAIALVLIAAGISHDASAHPGAQAGDTKRTVDIISTCTTGSGFNVTTYGYPTLASKADEKGTCPTGAVIALRSYLNLRPSALAANNWADKTGNEAVHQGWGAGTNKSYTVDHEVQYFEGDRIAIRQPIFAAAMVDRRALLSLASPLNKVTAEFSFATQELVSLKRAYTNSQQTLKIVSVCESRDGLFGYTKMGETKVKVNEETLCASGYQIRFASEYRISNVDNGFNRVEEPVGPVYDIYTTAIFSQFGLQLFAVPSSGASYAQAKLNFRTASVAHPVLVTVDERGQQVISVKPTISPYAL